MSSPRLPPEILDYITDSLHDDPDALKQCCLVSKSLVSRSRKYSFAHISFDHYGDYLKWRKTFPDPTNSPACRAHTLAINCDLMPVEMRWVQSFSSVERLILSQGGTVFINRKNGWILFIPRHRLR